MSALAVYELLVRVDSVEKLQTVTTLNLAWARCNQQFTRQMFRALVRALVVARSRRSHGFPPRSSRGDASAAGNFLSSSGKGVFQQNRSLAACRSRDVTEAFGRATQGGRQHIPQRPPIEPRLQEKKGTSNWRLPSLPTYHRHSPVPRTSPLLGTPPVDLLQLGHLLVVDRPSLPVPRHCDAASRFAGMAREPTSAALAASS